MKLVMFTQEKLVFFLVAKPQFQKVTDLKGKTIGISYFGSSTHMVAEGILRHYGMCRGKTSMYCRAGTIKEGWPRSM